VLQLGALLAAAALGAPGADAPPPPALPAPNRPVPREPAAAARALLQASAAARDAVGAWLAEGGPSRNPPPEDLQLWALYEQRIYLVLGDRPRLAARVLGRLPHGLRTEARDVLAARRALTALTPPTRRRRFKTGAALPADRLRGYYRKAQRRFGVSWRVLAAINWIETGFNRLRDDSTAGAQGPMQFIPSTWRAYGMGGDVRDPHDAILGAANYLRASGAPSDYGRALYAYNPSQLYVTAVLRYARVIRRRPAFFYDLYNWQVFVRMPGGRRRLTGPGL
jgi:membrane-bound lytic murein transglycosylase B